MTLHALVTNGGDGTVSTFTVTGTSLHRQAVSDVGCGSTLVIDRPRGLVHVGVKRPGPGIQTCRFDPSDGTLTPVRFTPTETTPTYLAMTSARDRLLVAHYHNGVGLIRSLDADGLPAEVTAQVEHRNVHSVAVSDDDRFCYFVSLGEDLVAGYAIGADGSLAPLTPAAAPPGSGPRHIVLSAAQDRAYVLTEFSGQALAFWRDTDTGEMTFAGASDAVEPHRGLRHSEFGADPLAGGLIWGADLHLSADQQYLWCSERTLSTIATLPVREDGVGVATAFIETETQPRGFGVSPGSDYVLVAGERSTHVSLYGPQPDGSLVLLDRAETGPGAAWVRFLET